MSPYTRHQILVLLTIVAVAGAGLAVGHWRRLHGDLADRIERLDRVPTSDGESVPSDDASGTPSRPPHRAKLSAVAPGTEPAPVLPAKNVDGPPLDLNSAPVDALTRLPGVGPVLAARIADARPYASVDDLRRVRGVGRAKLERFRELVTIAER
jgi:predicted flap endonuclease-1-like 5' DNA nuclease